MTLEETILDLTSRTPSGGRCRIGEEFFSVWYCSDIWEWEYRGVTYFDAQDLAEAMLLDHSATLSPVSDPTRGIRTGTATKEKARGSKVPRGGPVKTPVRSHHKVFSGSLGLGAGPVDRPIRHHRSKARDDAVRRTPCGDPCPCATPCARAPSSPSALV
ncbi:hypothetical protein GETHLI_26560 [Geothrix limicola]|uniref:Uncharacterized protein n=1 Tax=Geothrix limicola TaxID=2927978 RepID=A0ABQ5QH09_9BACT|nr:hypothetical protein [Geothrix limicola]GLH74154.1 hypothetical protein GETHLI_26560 [Geothrix limicola]